MRPEALHLAGEGVVAAERRREDHRGLILERLGQAPTVGDATLAGGLAVLPDQGNPGIAQSFESRGDRQLIGDLGAEDRLVGDSEVPGEVERAALSRQLDAAAPVHHRLEPGRAVAILDQAGDALGDDLVLIALAQEVDERLTGEDAADAARRRIPDTCAREVRG